MRAIKKYQTSGTMAGEALSKVTGNDEEKETPVKSTSGSDKKPDTEYT